MQNVYFSELFYHFFNCNLHVFRNKYLNLKFQPWIKRHTLIWIASRHGKTTAIRRTAFRASGVSQHHESLILKPLAPSQHYRTKGLQGGHSYHAERHQFLGRRMGDLAAWDCFVWSLLCIVWRLCLSDAAEYIWVYMRYIFIYIYIEIYIHIYICVEKSTSNSGWSAASHEVTLTSR